MPATTYVRRRWTNRVMLALCGAGAAIAVVVMALILGYTLVKGASYINIDFLTHTAAPVGQAGGGMRNEIIGTLVLVALGTAISVPVGLMSGIFVAEYASPRLAAVVRFAADMLSGVPSIVVGVFAYALLVRPLHSFSALSAGVALAIIMVPVVARSAEEALKLVPNSQREAALALGITRWRSIVSVVVPGALTGIITGVVLGVARIAGETAPLLFTAFGNNFGFAGLLKPIAALPLQIFNYAISPYPDLQRQAWAGAFVLIVLVLGLSIAARWLAGRRRA